MSHRDPAEELKVIAREMTHRVNSVEALHCPVVRTGGAVTCMECSRDHHPVPWPCDTIKAAQGDDIQ